MRLGRAVATAGVMACLIGGALVAARPTRGGDARERAARLFRAGLDHELMSDYGGAYRSYRASLDVDPSYLPSIFELTAFMPGATPAFVLQYLDSLGARHEDAGLGQCLRRWMNGLRGLDVWAVPVDRPGLSTAASDCEGLWRRTVLMPAGMSEAATRAAWSRYGDARPVAIQWLSVLAATGQWQELVSTARMLSSRRHHPLTRAAAFAFEAHALHLLGRDREALAVETRARADPAWSRRGFREAYFAHQTGHVSLLGSERAERPSVGEHVAAVLDEVHRAHLALADSGDVLHRALWRLGNAQGLLDRGRLHESLSLWPAALTWVDSTGDMVLRAFARMRYGRALVKSGRLADAEQQLLAARALDPGTFSPVTQKEVEHNLLHLYESLGKDAAARAAGEAFVRHAALGGLHPVRMMSQRDLARFLRARGEIELSRRHFEGMLADIDSLADHWFFAAEYYEMTGDLDRAADYYARSLKTDSEYIRPLAALVRVSLATGDTAAALRYARLHDDRRSVSGIPESAPVLPGVLASLGRVEEARAALGRARTLLRAREQVAAWVGVTLELAELELDDGRPLLAESLADSARRDAQRVGETAIAMRASGVSSVAAIRGGAPREPAMATLGRAVRDAERSGYPQLRAELRRLQAEAVNAAGDWRGALAKFSAAATLTDSIASNIDLEPNQAAFRSAQRRVYDDAFATIVAHNDAPDAAIHFARWAQRRKLRAFSAKTIGDRSGVPRVPRGHALIDYVMTRTTLSALVVTERAATVVKLPAHADSIRASIRSLHNGMAARVGSAIDVTRAQFPLETAHRLYRLLIEPLQPLLTGVTDLQVVPDGLLHLVPFDALVVVPAPATSRQPQVDAQFLLDHYLVNVALSADAVPDRRVAPDGAVLVVAPPTEQAIAGEVQREIGAIRDALPNHDVRTLAGSAATEEAVRGAAAGFAMIHFAAHASANELDPASSAISLHAAGEDDGALHAYEISRMKFRGGVVVLSACETASGRVLEGEGVLSLSRSVLRAGAGGTVATLWPVGPRAADVSGALYVGIASGLPVSVALRQAKLTLRRQGAPPFVWAPYTFLARPRFTS